MMRKRVLYALAVVVCVMAAMAAMPMAARAEAVTSTGTWGGATYTVYDDGTATVTGKFMSASPGGTPGALQSCKSIDVSGVDTSSVTNTSNMFHNCTQLVSIKGLASWDMSHVTDMGWMFQDCHSLVNLDDIGSWDVSNVMYMDELFSGCTSLKSVSMSGWDVSGLDNAGGSAGQQAHYTGGMFDGCDSLESLYIGPKITSRYDDIIAALKYARQGSGWRLEDGSKGPYTAEQLLDAWEQHAMPGHWVNTAPCQMSFDPNGGVGSMVSLEANPDVTVPAPTFHRVGCSFVGWNTAPDGTGRSFIVGAKVTPTEDMTLYAQWKEMPTTAKYSDGMDVTLHAGEQVTIKGLPAGAIYEVTEVPVPSGWTLVRLQGPTGVIVPSIS